jgi:hypothetical protein
MTGRWQCQLKYVRTGDKSNVTGECEGKKMEKDCAATPEIGDQFPCLCFLAIATQIVLVHIQIGAQGMQFLNVKMVAKRLPQPHALASLFSA